MRCAPSPLALTSTPSLPRRGGGRRGNKGGKSVPIPMLRSAKSLAHLHATVVVEELRRCGINLFCLSPGARAIPLVLALEDNPAVVTKLFNDERSAAFWAQVAAKGGMLPCLICTSGTAAANYLPPVVSAARVG